MKKQQKKNAASGKAAETRGATAAHSKSAGAEVSRPKKAEYRAFTMADYRAMEKVAKSIETACRIRRKYVMAMQTATEMIDRNLDKLREIVWNNND